MHVHGENSALRPGQVAAMPRYLDSIMQVHGENSALRPGQVAPTMKHLGVDASPEIHAITI